MTSEVEERIHKALARHPLERIEHGYRLVHPQGAGTSILRLLPANVVRDGLRVVSIAEIVARYDSAGLPSFHATGVQRLNSWTVHGAYHLDDGRLSQTAQYSIYSDEPAVHLAVQSILNAFGGQLPLGRSTALATTSAAALRQQRAHHRMPARWSRPLEEAALIASTAALRQRGLAASNNSTAVWAEFPLSGDCPSRSIDPQAETALLQVNAGIPHPIAGAGYLATISLPLAQAPANSAAICARLNALELEEIDFVPRLGAWGLHTPDDLPGYSCFIPSAEPLGELHMSMMWWCVRRAAWLRGRFWRAKAGLTFDAAGSAG
ncbi:MAG TPA: hypothetical protein VGN30_03670 [Steroidobacteraceae bacterium]